MKSFIKYFLVIPLVVIPTISFAYTDTTSGGQLSAEVSPKTPGAFTPVFIHLVSYEIDLNRSNVVWSINGKKEREGVGQDSLDFITGAVGKKIVVNIDATSQDGVNIVKQISLIPAEADLFWQSRGYVPTFYRGKSLLAIGNEVKLIARPNFLTETGTKLDPAKLVYKWSQNSSEIDSGYGKTNITLPALNSDNEFSVSVDISNLDGTLEATKTITIRPATPILLLYETNPLLGTIYNKTVLSELHMTEPEATITAEPYFIKRDVSSFYWSINNGTPELSGNNKNELVVRRPVDSFGESQLDVFATNFAQIIKTGIKIKFDRPSASF